MASGVRKDGIEGDGSPLALASMRALKWRLIGPHRGARSVAVAGDPVNSQTFYFGGVGGGVWKTIDGGLKWENISDGFLNTASVGAIAVAHGDPNVIYVGMGECCIRGNVSHGDGVYKSTDAGRSWIHLGLEATQNISRVRVHPSDPDLVLVAAFGHVFGPNRERGVYRSKDGGKTWQQILFVDERTGAIDLTMDPTNPRILYAAFWEAQRTPWGLSSGGPGSGLYKSTDGGDSWMELTKNPGFAAGLKGRIGITVSPAQPDRLWAFVEAVDGGIFRSDDAGGTWKRTNGEPDIRLRPWYFGHIFAAPQTPNTVFVLSLEFWKSIDGGSTFATMSTPHPDNHDLWIDPHDPQRMITGNDGGACISFNGGASWSTQYNQPTAELYHVTTDNRVPYRVYSPQQDGGTISVPSQSERGAITQAEWYDVGGSECGYIAVRPDDPNIVYATGFGGLITRYDCRTLQKYNISVWPESTIGWGAKDAKYRFQWTFPILISPHDPDVLYTAGNYVFRSTNEGRSWERISHDLTRNDPTKLEPSGGSITNDNCTTEYYCTVFTLAESPVKAGVLWAGTDDGLVHVSLDNGKSWKDVTPKHLPEWAMISIIDASPHDPAAAYVAATGYKLDDFRPYLSKTNDYGETWCQITAGIPSTHFTRVIREDPVRRGLLYAGTERGVYVSFDDGGTWQSLQGNLPIVPVHDIVNRDGDLIVASHGRSLWILDDITHLQQPADESRARSVHLFKPRAVYRRDTKKFDLVVKGYVRDSVVRGYTARCDNPPSGVGVSYFLKDVPEGEATLTILDAKGQKVRAFSSRAEGEHFLPVAAGMNRFYWDMRHEGARDLPGAPLWDGDVSGPVALPGRYELLLEASGKASGQPVDILPHPSSSTTAKELEDQFALLIQIRDKISETYDAVKQIRRIRRQAEDWVTRVKGEVSVHVAVAREGDCIGKKLSAIEAELIQVRAHSKEDPLAFPVKLNNKLASLMVAVASGEASPTSQARQVFTDLSARVSYQLRLLHEVITSDVVRFNRSVREAGVGPIVIE